MDYTYYTDENCEDAVFNTIKAEGRVAYLKTITSTENPLKTTPSFYPNPASSQLYISYPNAVQRVKITTIARQTLYEFNDLSQDSYIDINMLQPGLYIVVTTQKTGAQKTDKLIVKR